MFQFSQVLLKEEKQGMFKFQLIVGALWKPKSLKTNAKSNYANFSINMHMITLPNKREKRRNSSKNKGRWGGKRKKFGGEKKYPKMGFFSPVSRTGRIFTYCSDSSDRKRPSNLKYSNQTWGLIGLSSLPGAELSSIYLEPSSAYLDDMPECLSVCHPEIGQRPVQVLWGLRGAESQLKN